MAGGCHRRVRPDVGAVFHPCGVQHGEVTVGSDSVRGSRHIIKIAVPVMILRSDPSIVFIVDGDINGTGFIKIRYRKQTLAILPERPLAIRATKR